MIFFAFKQSFRKYFQEAALYDYYGQKTIEIGLLFKDEWEVGNSDKVKCIWLRTWCGFEKLAWLPKRRKSEKLYEHEFSLYLFLTFF